MSEMLIETSPALVSALEEATGLYCDVMNTGGGCMVARVLLGDGREVWLTRDESWIVGFYNFAADEECEGVCLPLLWSERDANEPRAVAAQVAAVVRFALGKEV